MPNYTSEGFFKRKTLFFLQMRSISLKCIKLYLRGYKTEIEGKSFVDCDVWECA